MTSVTNLILQLHVGFPRLSRLLMTLTRPQFELACKAYLAKYPTRPHPAAEDDLKNSHPSGWTWNEHAVRNAAFSLRQLLNRLRSLCLVLVTCHALFQSPLLWTNILSRILKMRISKSLNQKTAAQAQRRL